MLLTAIDFVSKSDTYMIPLLIGSSVDVLGTADSQRGRQCDKHYVCGEALVIGSHVFFRKARFAWREGMCWRYTPHLMERIARLDIFQSIWLFKLMHMMACVLVWWKSILPKVRWLLSNKNSTVKGLLCCGDY